MLHKEVSLTIENFYNDEDIEFRIKSKKAMQSILQAIADQGTHVGLFYGNGKNFILTMLLGANEHGMWLDVGPFPPENKQLLLSDKITFVSVHQHVKIQFLAHDIQTDLFENSEAFYIELPDYLLRIQRREHFRIAIPSTSPVKCIIPIQPENPDDPVIMREVPVEDISGGGIGLLCEENEAELLPKKVFQNCQILIPEVGNLTVTIEIRNGINFNAGNKIHKRVGCLFLRLGNQENIQLQRYITHLQSEILVKPE